MASRVEFGLEMEQKAIPILNKIFDEVEHIGGIAPYDFICTENGILYGVNVKSGKSMFGVTINNLRRLRNELPDILPSLMFFDEDYHYFFVLDKKYSKLPKKGINTLPKKTVQKKSIMIVLDDDSFYGLRNLKGNKTWEEFLVKPHLEEDKTE